MIRGRNVSQRIHWERSVPATTNDVTSRYDVWNFVTTCWPLGDEEWMVNSCIFTMADTDEGAVLLVVQAWHSPLAVAPLDPLPLLRTQVQVAAGQGRHFLSLEFPIDDAGDVLSSKLFSISDNDVRLPLLL